MQWLLVSVILFSFLFVIFSLFIAKNWFKRKLTKKERRHFKKIFLNIWKLKSAKEQIIEYDKLYHKILLALWYNWSFWEILKMEPIEISNINEIWNLHKIRNKLVHEFDEIDEKELKKLAKNYKKELHIFL